MRTAIFPGSFDPFTIGHADIVKRGLRIFDRIIIAIGFNINKPEASALAMRRAEAISRLYADCDEVEVTVYSGLTVQFAARRGAGFILRGVRDNRDFEYERSLADINARISDIETVLLVADPALSCVSSSAVRELEHHGYDISPFLPSMTKK